MLKRRSIANLKAILNSCQNRVKDSHTDRQAGQKLDVPLHSAGIKAQIAYPI